MIAERGHLFIPILIVLGGMSLSFSAPLCALVGALSCLPVALLRKTTREGISWRTVIEALQGGAKDALAVAMACACAGLVIGTISLTGLGITFTQFVIALSQNSLLLALVLTAMAGIVLGMGMPTTPAYIVMVSLLVPALVKLGVATPAAHMFALYFAVLSAITPPVALAVFAAAGLAKADMWESGWQAVRIGAAGFIVPFMFVYEPALLMIGSWTEVLPAVAQRHARLHPAGRGPVRLPAARVQRLAACGAGRHRAAAHQARLGHRPGRPGAAGAGAGHTMASTLARAASQPDLNVMKIDAVLWDFGGVILSSPFEAFNRYEAELGLPRDFIRRINAVNPDGNAWAQMERAEIDMDRFAELFEAEARALGAELSGHKVIELISGQVRPEMVEALKRVRQRYRIACITNNMPAGHGPSMTRSADTAAQVAQIMTLFEHVVESSKLNMRKPDPRIYRHACDLLGVAPEACVYLDDLGINLKPARAMGMATIKVESAAQALDELEALLGMKLR